MYSISPIFRMMLFGVCCALSVRFVTAQVTTATFYGIVNDATGAVVPGAMVSLTNVGTSEVYRKVSDAAGEFGFQFLPVGTYTLRIEAQGFRALENSGITFTAGQQTRQTYPLDVGSVTETLKVEGTAVRSVSSCTMLPAFTHLRLILREQSPAARPLWM